MRRLVRIADLVEAAVALAGRLATLLLVLLVFLVFGNVIFRYAFRMGHVGLQELEWHLLVVLAMIGISYALLKGEHVRVDFVYARFNPAVQSVIDIIAGVLLVAVSVLIIKLALPYVWTSYMRSEHSPNPQGLPYRFVIKSFIPIGFALLTMQGLVILLRAIAVLSGTPVQRARED